MPESQYLTKGKAFHEALDKGRSSSHGKSLLTSYRSLVAGWCALPYDASFHSAVTCLYQQVEEDQGRIIESEKEVKVDSYSFLGYYDGYDVENGVIVEDKTTSNNQMMEPYRWTSASQIYAYLWVAKKNNYPVDRLEWNVYNLANTEGWREKFYFSATDTQLQEYENGLDYFYQKFLIFQQERAGLKRISQVHGRKDLQRLAPMVYGTTCNQFGGCEYKNLCASEDWLTTVRESGSFRKKKKSARGIQCVKSTKVR